MMDSRRLVVTLPICFSVMSTAVIVIVLAQHLDTGQESHWAFSAANSTDGHSETLPSAGGIPLKQTTAIGLREDIPVIIWWTEHLYPHNEPIHKLQCSKYSCYATRKRTYQKHPQTRGFLFYGTELKAKDIPLPRLPKHEWALLHEESPLNNFMLVHALAMSVFNHTATYHRDSDFPLTLLSWPSSEYIISRKPVPTAIKNNLQKSKGLAPIVYVQSHCEVPSDRDRFVEQLMKYISIDSYGKCLHNKDLPENLRNPVESMFDRIFKDLMAEYKFHIAFENGICDDYMTEKLFRPLHIGSVPIYRGSPHVTDFAPDNHSVIIAEDFSSPQELAKYIRYLDENDEAYEEYLEFKRRGITNPVLLEMSKTRKWTHSGDDSNYGPFIEDFECHFCEQLNVRYENEKAHAVDPNIPLMEPKMTDGRKFVCPQPQPIYEPPPNDWWNMHDYPEQYWRGLDAARTLRDMLAANESDIGRYHRYADKYGPR